MKKSLIISIPEPCHEDWATMSATEKGKFCDVCTKEVIDFTSKTDEDLVKLLGSKTNVCGRLNTSQLNRKITLQRKSGIQLAPLAASFLLPFTLLSNANSSTKTTENKSTFSSIGVGRYSGLNLNRIQIITSGTISDVNGNPLRNVKVTVKETGSSEWTNKKGEYKITSLNLETLVFSAKGFETTSHTMANKSTTLNILLNTPFEGTQQSLILGKIAPQPIHNEVKIIQEHKENIKDTMSIILKGNITDESNLPLPGATIIIKHSNKGTQSDFDGNFQLEAHVGDTLVYSFIGYSKKEYFVSEATKDISINLKMEGEWLGEMVVITGGISSYEIEDAAYINQFIKPNFYSTPEQDEAIKKRREARDNGIAFKKLQQQKKKIERKRNNQ